MQPVAAFLGMQLSQGSRPDVCILTLHATHRSARLLRQLEEFPLLDIDDLCVGAGEGDMVADEPIQAHFRIPRLRLDHCAAVEEPPTDLEQQVGQEVLFRVEVPVDRLTRDSHFAPDIAERHGTVSVPSEQSPRRSKEVPATLRLLRFPARPGLFSSAPEKRRDA